MDTPRTPSEDRPTEPLGDQNGTDRRAAGTVFTVMFGALILSALMNADTMLARTESSELGRTRDVSLAVWRPVEAFSSTVGLTAPRSGLDALRGLDRSGPAPPSLPAKSDDLLAAEVTGPLAPSSSESDPVDPPGAETPAAEVTAPAEKSLAVEVPGDAPLAATKPGLPGLPPLETVRRDAEPSFALRRPTAEDPLRLLIVGDSILDALGPSVLRELGATGIASAVIDSRVSSGLSRPDFFDWPAHLQQVTPQLEPEIVVLMLGANDAQDYAIDGRIVAFGTEQWFDTYRQRVDAVLDQLTTEGRWVVWIGLPAMRTGTFDARMRQVNQLFVEEVARYPTATFVNSRAITVDEQGAYAAYLIDDAGNPQQIRQSDGIHFTPAGGDRLSPLVIAAINEIAPLY